MDRFSQWISEFSPINIEALGKNILNEEQIISLKQYNEALSCFKSDKKEEAFTAAKDAVEKNPRFTEAKILLAILYFMKNEDEIGEKILDEVMKEEKYGSAAARYCELTQLELDGEKDGGEGKFAGTREFVFRVRENRGVIDSVIRYITGIIAGLALALIIGLPSIFGTRDNSHLAEEKHMYYQSQIDDLTKKLEDYQEELKTKELAVIEYTKERDGYLEEAEHLKGSLLLYQAEEYLSQGKYEDAADIFVQIRDISVDEGDRERFEELDGLINTIAADRAFNTGYNMFQGGEFSGALEKFLKAEQYMPDYQRMDILLYYIGKSHMELKDYTRAKEYFKKVIARFSGGEYAAYSQRRIEDIDRISTYKEE